MSPTVYMICLLAPSMALVAGLVFTPLMRAYARKIGFVDRPDGGRKAHKEPVALGGGIAVSLAAMTGIVSALVASWLFSSGLAAALGTSVRLAMLAGAVLIVSLGLIDDAVAMRGRYKLLGQVLICLMLIYSGLRIENIHLLGVRYELESFAIPFTLFWLLGAINAINLIDGIDGLASSVGIILCLSVGAIMALIGRPVDALILLSLSGALAGFLRYNFAPATIYLGDAGSMLVGLVIGVLAIPGNTKSTIAMGLMIPLAVWSIPILDSAAAILRRKLTGRSLFTADRGHLHHSLLTRGWTVRQASTFIALICATTCISAVLSVVWRNELIALLTVGGVVLYLISTKTFGHIELSLVRDRFSYASLPAGVSSAEDGGRERQVRLQGSREWEKLWAAIIESADNYQLTQVKLSIDMPSLNEVFYATWDSKKAPDDKIKPWKVSHPLMLDGKPVGSMELTGIAANGKRSTITQVMQTLDFLEPIEDDIRHICERIRVGRQDVRVGRTEVTGLPAAGSANDESSGAEHPVATP